MTILLGHGSKQVELVFDLKHFFFSKVKLSLAGLLLVVLVLFIHFLIDVRVLITKLEERLIVRSKHLICVGVGCRPLVEVKCVVEDVGLKQLGEVHTLVCQVNQVVLKEVGIHN